MPTRTRTPMLLEPSEEKPNQARLATVNDQGPALKLQHAFYDQNLIPAEKKPYLVDHERSFGPYLAVGPNHYLLDACSQIASLGLGFNAGPLFGCSHYLEAWLNLKDTTRFTHARAAFESFLLRRAGWPRGSAFFCNSGAEAVEIALGHCYEKRNWPGAGQILAFEGSFHGRTMAALAATWNPSKRKPFEWPAYRSVFLPYPHLEGGAPLDADIPAGWHRLWQQTADVVLPRSVIKLSESDPALIRELDTLTRIRQELRRGNFFAILVEPMQCEGGDRYTTARFHLGLALLARTFKTPLIIDEVQTGFALGGEFFWHKKFNLRKENGSLLRPDYVVCAKKAQCGVVLSRQSIPYQESFCSASLLRGYAQAMVLDQFREKIDDLAALVRTRLRKLCISFPSQIHHPRGSGLAFAFDLEDETDLAAMVNKRFEVGLLFYPAGERTARFRLSLGFRRGDVDLLFDKLHALLAHVLAKRPLSRDRADIKALNLSTKYHSCRGRLGDKLARCQGRHELGNALNQRKGPFAPVPGLELRLVAIERDNFHEFRDRIGQLEHAVYEPSRRTPLALFERAANAPNGVVLCILKRRELAAMIAAGPLNLFPEERGVSEDPLFRYKGAMYVLATTVGPDFQRQGLGGFLKDQLSIRALEKGFRLIRGRNRDRHAREMLALNLSLGAYQQRYFPDDYPDSLPHGDAYYYSLPLVWKRPRLNLSDALSSPLALDELDASFLKAHLPRLVNKLTVSNFTSRAFLEELKIFLGWLPPILRHAYTTNGQSECVDKIVKVLWRRRRPAQRMLTFEGCFFGHGSFMARSLSGKSDYFPVDRLPYPGGNHWQAVLQRASDAIQSNSYLGVWVEPLGQTTMESMPRPFLIALRDICRQGRVPLIFNDTAGLFYRYDPHAFGPSAAPELLPDAGFAWLGGQMGVVYVRDGLYLNQPLMLISTWDGDEYALAAFVHAMKKAFTRHPKTSILRDRFQTALSAFLRERGIFSFHLIGGIGWIEGEPPSELHLTKSCGNRHLICPTDASMREFLSKFSG